MKHDPHGQARGHIDRIDSIGAGPARPFAREKTDSRFLPAEGPGQAQLNEKIDDAPAALQDYSPISADAAKTKELLEVRDELENGFDSFVNLDAREKIAKLLSAEPEDGSRENEEAEEDEEHEERESGVKKEESEEDHKTESVKWTRDDHGKGAQAAHGKGAGKGAHGKGAAQGHKEEQGKGAAEKVQAPRDDKGKEQKDAAKEVKPQQEKPEMFETKPGKGDPAREQPAKTAGETGSLPEAEKNDQAKEPAGDKTGPGEKGTGEKGDKPPGLKDIPPGHQKMPPGQEKKLIENDQKDYEPPKFEERDHAEIEKSVRDTGLELLKTEIKPGIEELQNEAQAKTGELSRDVEGKVEQIQKEIREKAESGGVTAEDLSSELRSKISKLEEETETKIDQVKSEIQSKAVKITDEAQAKVEQARTDEKSQEVADSAKDSGNRAPPGQEKIPPGLEKSAPGQDKGGPGPDKMPPGQEKIPPGKDKIPPGQQNLAGGLDKVSQDVKSAESQLRENQLLADVQKSVEEVNSAVKSKLEQLTGDVKTKVGETREIGQQKIAEMKGDGKEAAKQQSPEVLKQQSPEVLRQQSPEAAKEQDLLSAPLEGKGDKLTSIERNREAAREPGSSKGPGLLPETLKESTKPVKSGEASAQLKESTLRGEPVKPENIDTRNTKQVASPENVNSRSAKQVTSPETTKQAAQDGKTFTRAPRLNEEPLLPRFSEQVKISPAIQAPGQDIRQPQSVSTQSKGAGEPGPAITQEIKESRVVPREISRVPGEGSPTTRVTPPLVTGERIMSRSEAPPPRDLKSGPGLVEEVSAQKIRTSQIAREVSNDPHPVQIKDRASMISYMQNVRLRKITDDEPIIVQPLRIREDTDRISEKSRQKTGEITSIEPVERNEEVRKETPARYRQMRGEGKVSEENAGIISKTPGQREKKETTLLEKSVSEKRKEQKGIDERPVSKIDGKHSESIKAVRETGKLIGGAFVAPAVTEEIEKIFTSVTESPQLKQTREKDNVNEVDKIEEKEERGERGEGSSDEEGRNESPRRQSKSTAVNRESGDRNLQPKPQNMDDQKSLEHEIVRQNTKEVLQRTAAAQKDTPLKQAAQASKHAATCIESILKKSHKETWTGDEMAVKLIALLMKASSDFTFDHSLRVIYISLALADELEIEDKALRNEIEDGAMFHDIGMAEMDLNNAPQKVRDRLAIYLGVVDLKNCSFLHDIGKVKIPESILFKPSKLTDEEYNILKQHPVIGENILKPIPSMQHVLPVVRHHHERWDGRGYPDGLKGEDIPLSARIVSITDAFDAMVSDRPYRKGMPLSLALAELRRCAGSHFDPRLVEAFLNVLNRSQFRPS